MTTRPPDDQPTPARPAPGDSPRARPRLIDHGDDPAVVRAILICRRAYAEASRIAAEHAARQATQGDTGAAVTDRKGA